MSPETASTLEPVAMESVPEVPELAAPVPTDRAPVFSPSPVERVISPLIAVEVEVEVEEPVVIDT